MFLHFFILQFLLIGKILTESHLKRYYIVARIYELGPMFTNRSHNLISFCQKSFSVANYLIRHYICLLFMINYPKTIRKMVAALLMIRD